LRREHLDVRIAGVAAYSTLGWFRDPVLNSQLRLDDTELAAVLFHELAHQEIYVPGDAAFNESFATTVEIEGLRRWLAATGNPAAFETWQHSRARQQQFVDLVLRYRARLADLYASAADDNAKRAGKKQMFATLRDEYAQLKTHWDGDNRYDGWFAQDLNNAHLAGIGLYHEHVPELQRLLAAHGGDLPAFYRAVRALSRLPAADRNARLAPLSNLPVTTR
jgi:predicted aminopeptidase